MITTLHQSVKDKWSDILSILFLDPALSNPSHVWPGLSQTHPFTTCWAFFHLVRAFTVANHGNMQHHTIIIYSTYVSIVYSFEVLFCNNISSPLEIISVYLH